MQPVVYALVSDLFVKFAAAALPFPALYKLSVIAVNVLPARSALSGANFESQKFRVTNRTRHLAYIAVLVTLFLSVTAI